MEAKIEAMCLQAKERQGRRAKEGSSLRDFVESLANILISDFWTLELKTINYCYFKPSKFVIIC